MKKIIGRLIFKRDLGGIVFLTVISGIEKIEFKCRKKETKVFNVSKSLLLGDIVKIYPLIDKEVESNVKLIKSIILITRNKLYFPDKHKKIKNYKVKIEKSYIHISTNLEAKKVLHTRFETIRLIRKYMNKKKFTEIDTPILCKKEESSNCKTFKTYSKSIKRDLFLRISPEINIKKMIISGFNDVYEIGKNFRNENISKEHYPEFTTIEFYKTDKDYKWNINFTMKLIKNISLSLRKKGLIKKEIKLFKIMSMKESILKYGNVKKNELKDRDFLISKLSKETKLKIPDLKNKRLVQLGFFEEKIQKNLIEPTFITKFPIEDSPLAFSKNKKTAERFELFVSGIEIANGFTELKNYKEQKKRFMYQKKLNEKEINCDFIDALKFGMPNVTGCGIGIDRLIMIFTGEKNIKEVISLPEIRG
ncbi:amino acid--tRNA ligase-related protein [Candidatus Vidania fulgoroideorum]